MDMHEGLGVSVGYSLGKVGYGDYFQFKIGGPVTEDRPALTFTLSPQSANSLSEILLKAVADQRRLIKEWMAMHSPGPGRDNW